MSAPASPTPPPTPDSDANASSTYTPTARQRTTIYLTCALLVVAALVLLFVPTDKLPLPGRLALAAVNLILAATLALIVRQKSNPPA
jgi:hypothetical protein